MDGELAMGDYRQMQSDLEERSVDDSGSKVLYVRVKQLQKS
jgi:hypothetical protein